MPFFGSSKKSPQELVKAIKDQLQVLGTKSAKGYQTDKKVSEDLTKNLQVMKTMLYGSADSEPSTEVVAQLAVEVYNTGTLILLIKHLIRIDFEGRKDIDRIFANLLRRQIGTRMPTVEYLCTKQEVLFELLNKVNLLTFFAAIQLLGELLLDRHNFTTMTRYISSPDNLKLMMNMLREKSRNIQFEAFHVFKVFVANPNKPKPILDILLRNKERLVDFLTKFHTERSEDEQFIDEKTYLIKQITELSGPNDQMEVK
ncbi:protein Mo25-like [Argopecten irradians]|uniref:protein Mo25-like n=1 Tax=Argopecten irradians TaxID=31199 RepID=UPI0037232432